MSGAARAAWRKAARGLVTGLVVFAAFWVLEAGLERIANVRVPEGPLWDALQSVLGNIAQEFLLPVAAGTFATTASLTLSFRGILVVLAFALLVAVMVVVGVAAVDGRLGLPDIGSVLRDLSVAVPLVVLALGLVLGLVVAKVLAAGSRWFDRWIPESIEAWTYAGPLFKSDLEEGPTWTGGGPSLPWDAEEDDRPAGST